MEGVAGLAGLLAVAGNSGARQRLGLDEAARIMVFGTEDATDPQIDARIVGRSPGEVMS